MNTTVRRITLTALLVVAGIGTAVPASAHPHRVSVAHLGAGQALANGALHGPFVNGESCGGDPAAYGLETAHHGPDAGTPGKADGCYRTTGGVAPGQDVANPVIR